MAALRVFRLLPAALALCLASCVESTNPLSDPDKATQDAKLHGVWARSDASGGTHIVVIGRADEVNRTDTNVPAGIMRYAYSMIDADANVRRPSSEGLFVTTLGKESYANIFDIASLDLSGDSPWDKNRIRQYRLIKYRANGNKLEVWNGAIEAMAKAIESGKVRGDVEHEDNDPSKPVKAARFTDTTANLARYLAGGGAAVVFPDETKEEYARMPKAP
jgi:hypothetical protein